ncbi:hypothetical protein A3L04_05245 [Thermococcus chitonophagus]|uniref:Uncharacterized protein n=3 Tax=Thermococcus chitonophagus TaxID=54262 RepID=A0A2Z2N859_9EURY|nr:hypothetical protein [Thermococcus chitonophagus]ASJ16520.1 hypothetical protein A3L04_05245 [Thermococcus chitonophagus]
MKKIALIGCLLTIMVITPMVLGAEYKYDWDGLISIMRQSAKIIREINGNTAEVVVKILKNLNPDDYQEILLASQQITNLTVEKLSRTTPVRKINPIMGQIERLEYYAEIINDTKLMSIINFARRQFENGNIKATQDSIDFANEVLEKDIENLREVQAPTPQEQVDWLIFKYTRTLKYAIQVAIALPENESEKVLQEISAYENILKEATKMRNEGRYIEALSLLSENLDSLLLFQSNLERMHVMIMRNLTKQEGRILIIKLKLAAKKEKECQLREIALMELSLAEEDLDLGRTNIATLRIIRASRIVNYLTRNGGISE